MTPDEAAGLDVALNESSLHALSFDPVRARAELLLDVLTLPPEGPAPADGRVFLDLAGVSRLACTFTAKGTGVPLTLTELPEVVAAGAGRAMDGWEFVDCPAPPDTGASLDWRCATTSRSAHGLHVFQDRRLDLLRVSIWFDSLEVRTFAGARLAVSELIAGGKRWWDGLYAGDPRTGGKGIDPLG